MSITPPHRRVQQTMRFAFRCVTLAVLAAGQGTLLRAQAPTTAAAQTALQRCTYDRCALRLDNSVRHGARVVAGIDGTPTRLGFMGGGLAGIVADVPAAVALADRGHRHQMRGAIALVVSSFAISILVNQFADALDAGHSGSFIGAGAVALAAGTYGSVQSARASQDFSQAIWYYNREIPR
jgi:hypothetical protein